MSLIYAHKVDNKVRVLSDTKVSVHPDDLDRLKKDLNANEYNNIIVYGMLKTIIYKNKYTLSFAGNFEPFNKLLLLLFNNNIDSFESIVNNAFLIHKGCSFKTDFIITSGSTIYCIKDGFCNMVEYCWIGNEDAYNKLHLMSLAYPSKTITVFDSKGRTHEIPDDYSLIDQSFKQIINDDLFDDVGGLLVMCSFNGTIFNYSEEYSFSSGFKYKQVLKDGDGISFTCDVDDGGFSYQSFNLNNWFVIHIDQNDKCVVYKPGYSHYDYCNLYLPFIMSKEELESAF